MDTTDSSLIFYGFAVVIGLDVYWAEYQSTFPPGDDADDHDHAVRCAVEAVVEWASRWVTA